MRTEDLPELQIRLSELADAFGAKHPSKGAMRVWMDVLQEFSMAEIKTVLTDLPKKAVRFPAPADVFKVLSERRSDRLETESRQRAREEPIRVRDFPANSEIAIRSLAEITEILRKPRPDRRAWIAKIFKRAEAGDPTLCAYSVRLAVAAERERLVRDAV